VIVDPFSPQVICTAFARGQQHDFRLFKESNTHIHPQTQVLVDSGYQGIKKIPLNSEHPKKKSKKAPLTYQEKKHNRALAIQRVLNENVIGKLKRFKILAQRYRNRHRRFGLRFNLIAGLYNFELG
jgi:hypothetical protein